jgi:transcriptional regulator with XRE-family HTH domain
MRADDEPKTNGGRQVDGHVGERIRVRRTEMGLTQEQLAGVVGISYQQIQKYETGANRVSAGRLFEIGKAVGVGVDYFFEGCELSAPELTLPHGGRNRAAIELVRNFLELEDDTLRNAVATLLRALKENQDRKAVSD